MIYEFVDYYALFLFAGGKYGTVTYEDGNLVITRGTPASMPMYNAVQEVARKSVEIAREVFG